MIRSLLSKNIQPATCCCYGNEDGYALHPAFEAHSPEEFRVVVCKACGMGQCSPWLTEEELSPYYPTDYEPFRAKENPRDRRFRWFRTRYPKAGTILDVGAGSGAFLATMRRLGWKVQGQDVSANSARACKENFGLSIELGPLVSANLAHESFDVITAWEVLEHVENPPQMLRRMLELLKPGGDLHLSVPNSSSWSASLLGSAWVGWDLPRHRWHFTKETLARMAAENGFSEMAVATISHDGWIRMSAKSTGLKSSWLQVLRLGLVSRAMAALAQWAGAGESVYLVAKKSIR